MGIKNPERLLAARGGLMSSNQRYLGTQTIEKWVD